MTSGIGRKPFLSMMNSDASSAPSSGSVNCPSAGGTRLKKRTRALSKGLAERDREDRVAANHVERERTLRAQRAHQRLHRGDAALVDAEDHVAAAQAVVERIRAGFDRGDDDRALAASVLA